METQRELPRFSKLLSLGPFMDSNGLLRVRERIINSDISFEQKHPIILPKSHKFTELLIKHEHVMNLHTGSLSLLGILAQRYWIIGCRDKVRQVVHRCNTCFRLNAQANTLIMEVLPAERVTPARPFLNCGADYSGPINVKTSSRRGTRAEKAYICVFICLATKAIYLKLASSLTTTAFLAALKRFVSRRGLCANMYSDCGTNFVGANREFQELNAHIKELQKSEQLAAFLTDREIHWHFNPRGHLILEACGRRG